MKAKDTVTENARQVVIHPVPGGKIILFRYGLVCRVLVECPEGTVEMDQKWVARYKLQILQIFVMASAKIRRHGLDVASFDSIYEHLR
jgi:hypothetical protein